LTPTLPPRAALGNGARGEEACENRRLHLAGDSK
jgi:hypothetical protein